MAVPWGMWDLYSLTRDWIRGPCIGSAESEDSFWIKEGSAWLLHASGRNVTDRCLVAVEDAPHEPSDDVVQGSAQAAEDLCGKEILKTSCSAQLRLSLV